jgi:quercetin dioxygenase-like cupin family protein
MPVISGATAPTFALEGVSFTGLAAPSRGSAETSMWRVAIAPHTPGAAHHVSREEIFVAVRGQAVVTLGPDRHDLLAGDALVVPAGTEFALANESDDPFEAVCALPVGGQATMPGGEPFSPPWTV